MKQIYFLSKFLITIFFFLPSISHAKQAPDSFADLAEKLSPAVVIYQLQP